MPARVLIVGANGMLGHKLWQVLSARLETYGTVRTVPASGPLEGQARVLSGVDVTHFDSVVDAVRRIRPDLLVNAAGIVKQVAAAQDPVAALLVNAIFPHRLAALCDLCGAQLIHISTDCVFSGSTGMYTEDDLADPRDLYGQSKLLGEVVSDPHLTIRTSIIGRELTSSHGLVEWFLARDRGHVTGFTEAIFSGLTTLELSNVIADIVERGMCLEGLYHVSTDPINKYELLALMSEAFELNVEIEPVGEPRIDRSLDSKKFRSATGYEPEPWKQLVHDMADDAIPYERWRTRR